MIYGVLQIPNLPAWSLHEPKIDLYVLTIIRRTGSSLIVPLIQSYFGHYMVTWSLQPSTYSY